MSKKEPKFFTIGSVQKTKSGKSKSLVLNKQSLENLDKLLQGAYTGDYGNKYLNIFNIKDENRVKKNKKGEEYRIPDYVIGNVCVVNPNWVDPNEG